MSDSTTAPDSPPSASHPDPASPRTSPWKRLGLIASTIVAVVGAVTGVITVAQALTRDTTSYSHLVMSAQVVADGVTEWAVPADALTRDDFPSAAAACDAEQIAWLQSHAVPLERRMTVSLRNTATEGPMLALLDFRSDAPPADERGTIHVRLTCDPSGTVPGRLFYGRLDADRDDVSAERVSAELDAPPHSIPPSPVAFNLAPGESGTIPLELFSRSQAEGSVVVTVLSRAEERVLTIEGSAFDMPALLFGGDVYLFTGSEGLTCLRVDAGSLTECSLDELHHEVDRALAAGQ